MEGGVGVSLGPVLFGGGSFSDWAHEYGHSNQNRILGPLFLPVIGVPSILSAGFGLNSYGHDAYWTETWANRLGREGYYRREYNTN